MTFKVAIYGNNLNLGYFLTTGLRELGIEATLFCPKYQFPQERHEWWTDTSLVVDWVKPAQCDDADLCVTGSLQSSPRVRALYSEVAQNDALLMMEDGPAVFSELIGPRKVFLSAGSDLQIMPFKLRVHFPLRKTCGVLKSGLTSGLHGDAQGVVSAKDYFRQMWWWSRFQKRQRIGLKQCSALICSPHQNDLISELGLQFSKVRYLPIPMTSRVLSEIDDNECNELGQRYCSYDLVFFHPTRQFYLPNDGDVFLKNNDSLIHAYAQFVRMTEKKVRLIMISKGREPDLLNSQKLVRELGIEADVEWLPEMPNRKLRAYYSLRNIVVCDQFNRRLSILGNIGREASYFGRPIITSFDDNNCAYFGSDMPTHVYPAYAAEEILDAMLQVSKMSKAERTRLSDETVQWYWRNLDETALLPKYLKILKEIDTATRNVSIH